MKKFFVCSAVAFFVLGVFSIFAISSDRIKTIMKKQGHSYLADGFYRCYLAQDKDGTLFLYSSDDGAVISVFREDGTLSREEASSRISNSFLVTEVIDENGYFVYRVMYSPDNLYYVRTPRGNWYSVSNKIKVIDTILEGL